MRRTLIVFIAIQVAFGYTARSGMAQDVEELARQGAELFQQGRYREAAEVLMEAYSAEPVPVLLYNIARAFQQGGRCYQANEFFDRYLATSDMQARAQAEQHGPGEAQCAAEYSELMAQADDALNAGELERAEQLISQAIERSDEPNTRIMYEQTLFHLGRCEESRDFIQNVQAETDFTAEQSQTLADDLARAVQCIEDRECAELRGECEAENQLLIEEAATAGDKQRLISYIVGGVGAAVLVGAIIHDAVSQGTIDDYEEAARNNDVQAFNDLRDDVDSAKTLSWILYSVGVAGIVTGVIVYFTAPHGEPEGLQDCNELCWDVGFGTASGGPGVWFSGTF